MEHDRGKQSAPDSGREGTPFPTRFGHNKPPHPPHPWTPDRHAAETTNDEQTALADDSRSGPSQQVNRG
jgi:hypothetical protein